MITAALSGALDEVSYDTDSVGNVEIPMEVPGVPTEAQHPRSNFKDASDNYRQARRLAEMFAENYKSFAAQATDAVRSAGPNV